MRESAATLVIAATAEETRGLGMRLGKAIRCHRDACVVITLSGELGAGKTTLVSGILRAFGFDGPVKSPTYTLIEPYEFDGQSVYHLDLYRLANSAEVEGLALRDLLNAGSVFIVEWPERAAGQLPPVDLALQLNYLEQGRELRLQSRSPLGVELMEWVSS